MIRFAKLIDGAMLYAPNPIRLDREDIFTNDPSSYGYKPVICPEPPQQEGYYAVFDGWVETETEIVQLWRLDSVPEEATSEDYEAALARLGVNV